MTCLFIAASFNFVSGAGKKKSIKEKQSTGVATRKETQGIKKGKTQLEAHTQMRVRYQFTNLIEWVFLCRSIRRFFFRCSYTIVVRRRRFLLIEVVGSNRFDLNHQGGRPRVDGDSRIGVDTEGGAVGVFEGEGEGGEGSEESMDYWSQ